MYPSRFGARLTVPALALSLLVCGLCAASGAQAAGNGKAAVQDDFNGDGYRDLVVGAPGATAGGKTNAGYVAVMYGSAHGLSASWRTVISRATAGIAGSPATNERFGTRVSTGDLDGDGRTDLVISAYGNAGSVIVWGGRGGLSGGTAVPGYTNFSRTGDYNGDGRTDVALFATGNSGNDDPGGTDAVVWSGPVSRAGVPAPVIPFGGSTTRYMDVKGTASGDINGNGYADLAAAAVNEDSGNGAVWVLRGRPAGVVTDAALAFGGRTIGAPYAGAGSAPHSGEAHPTRIRTAYEHHTTGTP